MDFPHVFAEVDSGQIGRRRLSLAREVHLDLDAAIRGHSHAFARTLASVPESNSAKRTCQVLQSRGSVRRAHLDGQDERSQNDEAGHGRA